MSRVGAHKRRTRHGTVTVRPHSRKLQPRRAGKNAMRSVRALRRKQYAAGAGLASLAALEFGGWGAATVVAGVCIAAGLVLVGAGSGLRRSVK